MPALNQLRRHSLSNWWPHGSLEPASGRGSKQIWHVKPPEWLISAGARSPDSRRTLMTSCDASVAICVVGSPGVWRLKIGSTNCRPSWAAAGGLSSSWITPHRASALKHDRCAVVDVAGELLFCERSRELFRQIVQNLSSLEFRTSRLDGISTLRDSRTPKTRLALRYRLAT